MKVAIHTEGKSKKALWYPAMSFLSILGCAIALIATGCATTAVRLQPSDEVKAVFADVDIDPQKYVFFTTGPDAAPEAVLLIENQAMADFDSSGWRLRDKNAVMDILTTISKRSSEGKKYGYKVTDDQGEIKGMMFTAFRQGRVFVDKEEGTFSVATPAMMDTGIGTSKRTGCSISICQ